MSLDNSLSILVIKRPHITVQEKLITEMTAQMQAMKSSSGSGKSYMLHFMTREAADQEQEVMRKEIQHWKDVAKRKDIQLAEKDKQIAEANAHGKSVTY